MELFKWSDDCINNDYLLRSETSTQSNTFKIDNAINNIFINFINIFFKCSYFLREDYEENSDDHLFWSISEITYYRIPYTIRNIQLSWQIGYYLESLIIFRHFWECLALILYFKDKKDKYRRHVNPHDGYRALFKDVFGSFSPTLYEFYGKFFSNIAHGNLATICFRVDYSNFNNPKSIMGNEYNDQFSKLIFIPTLTISYGYLNKIPEIFPSFSKKIDKDVLGKINILKKHLDSNLLNENNNEFIQNAKTMIL